MQKFLVLSLFLVFLFGAAGAFIEENWNSETLKFDVRELLEAKVKLPPTEAEEKHERIFNACILDKGAGLDVANRLVSRALNTTCKEIAKEPSWLDSLKYEKNILAPLLVTLLLVASAAMGVLKGAEQKSTKDWLISALVPFYGLVYFFTKGKRAELLLESFRNSLDFKGRSRRKGFWVFHSYCLLVLFILAFIATGFEYTQSSRSGNPFELVATIFLVLFVLPYLIGSVSISVRRLHDIDALGIDWTGWWLLLVLIPYLGVLFLLVLFCQKSDLDTNKFGLLWSTRSGH